ncbi:MAG: CPBP family intramembrane metalloprotease, partial [Bacillota bacterium]|nr:CPBP family intramembrane metalloprotease [Bacillota bacterium]
MDKKKTFIYLIITIVGAFAACFGINMFNSYVLMSLPLILRMILMVVTYWVIALVPIVIMVISKMSLESIGFKKENIGSQIVTGIIFGIVV